MKFNTIVAAFALVAVAAGANASVCKKDELGGIVVSNVKHKDGSYTTKYKGDKSTFNTSADAPKEELAKFAKLKVGDIKCFHNDGY